jgi:predicted O-methyltransferase YrrM
VPTKFQYTADWVNTSNRLQAWEKHLKPLAGKPVNYLEIGTFEGRSMVWMLENVLTHPTSRATGIDFHIRPSYLGNLALAKGCDKVKNIQAMSHRALKTLPAETFDLVYIDGSHQTQDVLIDAVMAFDLVKDGGLILFDDYELFYSWQAGQRVKNAIDAFVAGYRDRLEVVHHEYQVLVKKRPDVCASNAHPTSRVGGYCYNWITKSLLRIADRQAVALSAEDQKALDALVRAAPFTDIRGNPEFQSINKRLHLFDL